MMSDEMLSQDEIDAFLGGTDDGGIRSNPFMRI